MSCSTKRKYTKDRALELSYNAPVSTMSDKHITPRFKCGNVRTSGIG